MSERTWLDQLPPDAGAQHDGGFLLPLQRPVQLGQREVTELRFRPPKGKDYRGVPMKIEGADLDVLMSFGARLCGQIPQVIDELSGPDLTRFLEVTSSFFDGTGAPTGTSRSDSSPASSGGDLGTLTT